MKKPAQAGFFMGTIIAQESDRRVGKRSARR
jgi:hypothetical protein